MALKLFDRFMDWASESFLRLLTVILLLSALIVSPFVWFSFQAYSEAESECSESGGYYRQVGTHQIVTGKGVIFVPIMKCLFEKG